MLTKKEQYEIAIGALLHDVGKFKQRAFGGKEKDNISKEAISMEAQILPVFNQRYSYRHALWSYDFFQVDFLPLVREKKWDLDLDWEKIARESSSHHRPNDDISKFISQADKTSAGLDRYNGKTDEEEIDQVSGKYSYLKKPLRSVFSSIDINNTDLDEIKVPSLSSYAYPLKKSNMSFFPQTDISFDQIALDYKKLWDQFIAELQTIKQTSTLVQLTSKLKDILLEYTWCIPSATNDGLNDISLYDHSVTTMALSLALANTKNKEKPFRLFAADLSGIQSFIFQSSHDSFPKAAKVFRGRSFIISAISTAYRLEIEKAIGLIPFTDIIEAGGKFTLVIPNDDEVISKLDELQKEQESYFLRAYLGTLCVLSDYSLEINAFALSQSMTGEDNKTNFSKTLYELSKRLNDKKSRKFSSVNLKGNWVVKDVDMSGTRCKACGIRKAEEDGFCSDCANQIGLGTRIPISKFVTFVEDSSLGTPITSNYSLVLGDNPSKKQLCYNLNSDQSSMPMWRLNTYTPEMDFEEIAKSAIDQEGKGKPFLAYVKLDVDNLGEIFIYGLPDRIYSLSRYVTISRMLHHFFNVQVKQLLQRRYPEAYTVISGGDDVFIILPWNQAAKLILELQTLFSLFCCQNPQIHFSSAIVVTGKTTPFALVNEETNKALDQGAKKKEGKNAVKYFNKVLTYNQLRDFIQDVEKLKSYMEDFDGPVSTSLVYRIYGYVNDRLSKTPIRDYSSYSKIYYDIGRNIKSNSQSNNESIVNEARNFFLRINQMDTSELEQFQVVLIHTMYSLRTDEQ